MRHRVLVLVLLLLIASTAWTAWWVFRARRFTVRMSGAPSATFTGKWAVSSDRDAPPAFTAISGAPPTSFQVLGDRVQLWIAKTGPGLLSVDVEGAAGGGGSSIDEPTGTLSVTVENPGVPYREVLGGNVLLLIAAGGVLTWVVRRERRRRATA